MESQETKTKPHRYTTKSVHTMSLERMIQSTTDQAYIRTRMIEHVEMDHDGDIKRSGKLVDPSKGNHEAVIVEQVITIGSVINGVIPRILAPFMLTCVYVCGCIHPNVSTQSSSRD
jgi:hypothetical protein